MGKTFNCSKRIRFVRDGEYVLRRVSKKLLAHGKDVAVVGRFSIFCADVLGAVAGLNEGDIIKVHADGRICRLWDSTSIHNCLFVTERCNFRCVMCPQPPGTDDEKTHLDNLKILQLLPAHSVSMIGITGGEPTLYPERLIEYFDIINEKFPTARVEVLTNGSLLSNFELAKRLALAAPYDICYCVSIHGDTPSLAESIMRTSFGWDRAMSGIMNLARLQQPVEIRVVITKRNHKFLNDIAYFISRNMPFASHIAFMGQEVTGLARENFDEIWVEPLEYRVELSKAVQYLADIGFDVSIYNVPLCLLPSICHRYAARSISDWKQCYLDGCGKCGKRDACCGFFSTSGNCVPQGISPYAEVRRGDGI